MHVPSTRRTRLIAVVATACAATLTPVTAVAAAASPTGHARATAGSSSPGCVTSELVVWLNTEGFGFAGGFVYSLEFTNLSGHTCSLSGYPGVSAVTLDGHRIGHAAARGVSKVTLVSLASGATTTAALQIENVRHYDSAECHQVAAAGLMVYPPHQVTYKLVPFPFEACSLKDTVYMGVKAVPSSAP